MQVLCERSNAGNDVRCDVCGQGLMVHWTRIAPSQRAQTRARVIQTLRRYHTDEHSGHHAHPETRFSLACELADDSPAKAFTLSGTAA